MACPQAHCLLEAHRKLTYAGAALLVLTFVLNHYHGQSGSASGFNYAYIPGVLMLAAFAAAFVIFTKKNL